MLFILSMKNLSEMQSSADQKEIHNEKNTTSIEYYKGQAFLSYKKGWKDVGSYFLDKALEKAEKEGAVISIQEINDIMEGKVTSANTKRETGSIGKETQGKHSELQSSSDMVRTTIEAMLAPLKQEFEKFAQDIAQKIRQELMFSNLFMPQFMNN